MITLSEIIKNTKGKFFTVTFTKKDGTIRTLNGRLGVNKYLKGGKSTLNPEQFITVYDMKNEGYRAVNVDTIQSVIVDGIEYTYAK